VAPERSQPEIDEPPRVHEALRHAVDEAARLLRADGAILYLLQPDGKQMRWAYDAGISTPEERGWMRSLVVPVGVGMFGRSVAERSVRITHDYAADTSFAHAWMLDEVVRTAKIRSLAAAPLVSGDDVIGALGVYSSDPAAFEERDVALLNALAEHAGGSVANARLIEELASSRQALAERVASERALREIAARMASIADQDVVLQRVVDESMRLLAADGAHLCLLHESGAYLTPVVAAGSTDDVTRTWLNTQRFPIGSGMNGLAAQLGHSVKTVDYATEPRIPHEPGDTDSAERLRIRGMAVAPLRTAGGRVIGTLAITHESPRETTDDDLAVLQALADHAAIAVTNARLYAELRQSEERYRYILRHSPDVAWSIDESGHFTFISDAVEQVVGWRADELLGHHFSVMVHQSSEGQVNQAWAAISQPPFRAQALEFNLPHRDGSAVPADMRAAAIVVDGEFRGAHGRVRDLREQVRMQGDLQRQAADLAASEERAHLARELHDSVTQALFSMTLTTRTIELLLDRDLDQARARLGELRELERDALAEMRGLIFELRPANIEADGLTKAVRTHAAAVEGRTGLPIAVDCGIIDRLPIEIESGLYRITQEAIHNVVKHASANQVRISLEQENGEVHLRVEDDGVGFDPRSSSPGTLGLAGMRHRAERLGGTFTVESEPGHGSRVEVVVPAA
jgi:PAS domain S-box-containing protein